MSIIGSILFNLSINNLFYIIEKKASVFNFADNNTLSAYSKTVEGLLHILQSESLKTIKWFKEIDSSWGQILGYFKREQDQANEKVQIEEGSIKAVSLVELLGTEIDDKKTLTYTLVKFVTLKQITKTLWLV